MSSRVWYPQLDVYDAIRRFGILLNLFDMPPGKERLYIADFYLANSPLLHQVRMSADHRKEFNLLRIDNPEKSFLQYPSAPVLFNKMEPIQKEALNALIGKGLAEYENRESGSIKLSEIGAEMFSEHLHNQKSEVTIAKFITTQICGQSEAGNKELRSRTGLRRVNL